MAKKKALTGTARRKALERAKIFLSWTQTRSVPEQTFFLLNLFEVTFKSGITPVSLNYGKKQIKEYLFSSEQTYPVSVKELDSIYYTELKFISDLSHKTKFPSYLVRLLALNFLDNLEGRSRWEFPWGVKLLSSDRFEDLKTQMAEVYNTTFGKDQGWDNLSAKLPEEDVKHILSKAFYDIDLKFLILRSEDPLYRKGFHKSLSHGSNEKPYDKKVKSDLVELIKAYIYLAHYLKLSEDIELLDKNLPVRDERVYDILCELRGKDINYRNTIHGKLLKIFTPKKRNMSTH